MITEIEIDIAKGLIATGVVDEVYHSVELITQDGKQFPVYNVGNEQIYIGPDDAKGRFAYIRQTGPVKVAEYDREGSCAGMNKLAVPLRIVVFNDHEKENHDALIQRLLAVTFLKGVALVSFNKDKSQLIKQESTGLGISYDATTFWVAIDVRATVYVSAKMCESDTCVVHSNPFCKPLN